MPACVSGGSRIARPLQWGLAAVAFAAVPVAISGGASSVAAPLAATAPLATQVVIKGFMFEPRTLTARVGATITWINQDEEPHTVRSDAGLFASSALDTGERFRFRFDQPGTYHFVCSIHPKMTGTIVIQ